MNVTMTLAVTTGVAIDVSMTRGYASHEHLCARYSAICNCRPTQRMMGCIPSVTADQSALQVPAFISSTTEISRHDSTGLYDRVVDKLDQSSFETDFKTMTMLMPGDSSKHNLSQHTSLCHVGSLSACP